METNGNCWKQANYVTPEINLEASKTKLELSKLHWQQQKYILEICLQQ